MTIVSSEANYAPAASDFRPAVFSESKVPESSLRVTALRQNLLARAT